MTRSLYVVGVRGAGKSTLVRDVLADLALEFSALDALFVGQEKTGRPVRVKGHHLLRAGQVVGAYVGENRAEFPGTDALDFAAAPVANQWLETGPLPGIIVGEGARLATKGFHERLQANTDYTLVLLDADPSVLLKRYAGRGSTDPEQKVRASRSQSVNLAAHMSARGACVLRFDTTEWETSAGEYHLAVDLIGGLLK